MERTCWLPLSLVTAKSEDSEADRWSDHTSGRITTGQQLGYWHRAVEVHLSHRRNYERIAIVAYSIRPTRSDLLNFSPKSDAFHSVLIRIAESRPLPAAETVMGPSCQGVLRWARRSVCVFRRCPALDPLRQYQTGGGADTRRWNAGAPNVQRLAEPLPVRGQVWASR